MRKRPKLSPKDSVRPSKSPTPVAGIGASAGGLEAFTQILNALPIDTGLAFVLVQHLEPKHESVLTTLLARATKMPVHEVREGMHVQPDHVYVIPANADMTLLDGLLHLVTRKAPAGRHLPIDYFFHSLAEARGAAAIGVVLSGTASDGTAGIKAIKAAGGVTFAQEPESAKFDGMPRNAIASGCVDFVLPPDGIAKELARLVNHPFTGNPTPALPAQAQEWGRLFHMLRTAFGVDFSLYKQSTIKRRLARRMTICKVDRLGAYLKILERNREEQDALFAEVLILVTGFFRDAEVFAGLKKAFRKIMAAKPKGEPFRVWVAGCATGQEAYSIAISLLEFLGDDGADTPIQLFATDVSERAIEKARAGIYAANEMTDVSAERKRRFFTRVDGHYQVNHSIREMCVFARHDLTQDPPFSRLDLLTSRNVLIYFEAPLQKRAVAAFHYALRNHGLLVLGKTEGLTAHGDLFTADDRKNKFFSRNPAGHVSVGKLQPAPDHLTTGKAVKEVRRGIDLEKEADHLVWERYGHAGLVVNDEFQILHFRGDTSPYMKPAPGKATFQLMRMLREELAIEVRAALQKSRRTGMSVRSDGIQIRQDRRTRQVNVDVRPLSVHGVGERCFLILFEETAPMTTPRATAPARGEHSRSERQRLENELARTREYIQAIIRDQESTNEELKTANEEAMSSMEELQSTNEELETAKEELQSSNEELVTLNEQLQNRNSELAQTTDDLSNVLSGADIPIVILGSDRRIRLFTPPAAKLMGLIAADVGRPIAKLRIGVNVPDFDEIITAAGEGSDLTREVQSEAGRWFQLHVRPFRSGEDKIEGVVLVFLDIHEIRQQKETLETDRNFISAILDAAVDLLVVVLDREGRVVHFNRVAQQVTGYSIEDVQGRRMWEFLLAPEEMDSFKAAFGRIAEGARGQRESQWMTKDGRRALISWSPSVGRATEGDVEFVILTGVDRTDRQEAQQKVRESEATIRALLETATEAILAIDREGTILLANAAAEKMYGYHRNQLIGQPMDSLVPIRLRKEHAARRKAWFDKPSHRPMEAGFDLAGLRRNGTEFPEEVTLSLVETREGTLGICFISDITERKRAEEILLQYQGQLRRLTGNLFAVQESGNRELARELHDGFSQQLAALGMEISVLLKSAPREGRLVAPLTQMARKIRSLAEDMHRAARQLHPAVLDELGLEAALRDECEGFERQTEIQVAFTAENPPESLATDVSLCLYRVAQEALRNILKHAGATSVGVRIEGRPGHLMLRVEDDGAGFDTDAGRKRGGLGMISMEERVRLVGGTLAIRSSRGKGTIVEVTVPIPQDGEK